ncbi:hypothetical protein C7450_11074 [Chelatococcus asaccharovorans]|uniref:Uncharacterized protein n=1 Tax=Chelatococcus asaccharovorans TaxID=28210 RepID=A0A2V3U0G2_9HYPH|nr:hypothetical protein [Chelatococcus asaccharovorans]PXW55135.1 hypothetical protein C7450_11074 [Chelatococcus asaccharovorans]
MPRATRKATVSAISTPPIEQTGLRKAEGAEAKTDDDRPAPLRSPELGHDACGDRFVHVPPSGKNEDIGLACSLERMGCFDRQAAAGREPREA